MKPRCGWIKYSSEGHPNCEQPSTHRCLLHGMTFCADHRAMFDDNNFEEIITPDPVDGWTGGIPSTGETKP